MGAAHTNVRVEESDFMESGAIQQRHTSDALCDIVTGHLKMNTSWERSHFFMDIKESFNFTSDVVIPPGLVTIYSLRVAMDWITNPCDHQSMIFDSLDKSRQMIPDIVSPHTDNDT